MKYKDSRGFITAIIALSGFIFLVGGILTESWYKIIGGFILTLTCYGSIRVVHFQGEED